jgi:SAM-dependent methyltransferase
MEGPLQPVPGVGSRADSSGRHDLSPLLERLYRRRFSEHDLREMRDVWRVLVEEFFQRRIEPGATVLDIGAGACLFINHVRAARRIALDANPDLLKQAAPGVEAFVTRDLSLREVADGSVDHAFLSNFLEHLPDYLAVLELLAGIHRKLRPGGSLMVLQPNFRLAPGRYFDFVDHRVILTDASLVEALEVAGFEVRERRARFLPFTSKSRLPKRAWMVSLYLRLRPAQWLLGGQSFVRAVKPAGS